MKNLAGIQAFGKHLRKMREEHDLSQQELADYADVSKLTIQRIELAKSSATLDILLSLANALKLSVRDLMDFQE